MAIRESRTDKKYGNYKDIEGESPRGKKYKFTDGHWMWHFDRSVKGLPDPQVEEAILEVM